MQKFIITAVVVMSLLDITVATKLGIDIEIEIDQQNAFQQSALNLTAKKYTAFDAKDQEIPWAEHNNNKTERGDTFKLLLNHSQLHQPSNVSTINWAGVPDQMVEAMKRENKMPGRGINHKVLGTGPWEPHSFENFSQKFLPNGTEYLFLTGDQKLEESVQMISKEMEKLGVHGAYDAFKMLRPKAFRTNIWRWMALWYYGGIYLDAKVAFTQDTSSWINYKDDEFILCAANNMYTNDGFLAMTQYHPYGLLMVKAIVDKVNNRFYHTEKDYYTPMNVPTLMKKALDTNNLSEALKFSSVNMGLAANSDLNITGPEAVESVFIENHQLTWDNVRCYWDQDEDNHKWHVYTADNQNHKDKAQGEIMTSDPEHDHTYKKMKECKTCNDYHKLFNQHGVYCDEPGLGPEQFDEKDQSGFWGKGTEPLTCDGKEWTSFLEPNSWHHQNPGFTSKDVQGLPEIQRLVFNAFLDTNNKSFEIVKAALESKNITKPN